MKIPTFDTLTETPSHHTNIKNKITSGLACVLLLAASVVSQASAIDVKWNEQEKPLENKSTKFPSTIAWENSDEAALGISSDKKYTFTDNRFDATHVEIPEKKNKKTSIPEPATFLLMFTGLASLMMARRQ